MTREHKLAVVLGFGLLLFVGILVSDHFSATQRRNSADLVANTGMRMVRPLAPVSIQSIQSIQVNNRTARGGPLAATLTPSGDSIAQPENRLPGQTPAVAPMGVPAELYTLKEGETLYKICQSRYGNGNLWQKLADFNKATVSNPTRLRKGTTIRLPAASVLRGEQPTEVVVVPTAVVQQQAAAGMTQPPQAVVAQREIVVQKGDTLGTIAARELGSSKKWELLYDANRDRLKSPSALKIGAALRIPSDAH